MTLSRQVEDAPGDEVQAGFDRAYAGRHDEFKAVLLDARDYMGRLPGTRLAQAARGT